MAHKICNTPCAVFKVKKKRLDGESSPGILAIIGYAQLIWGPYFFIHCQRGEPAWARVYFLISLDSCPKTMIAIYNHDNNNLIIIDSNKKNTKKIM